MTTPWLSVVMPTFNGESWIRTAMESICRQDDDEIEILVVDDGSTDATLEHIAAYAGRLQLEIVSRAHSGNWIKSVNHGMERAHGRYVCWLHQDDVWEFGRLKALRGLLETSPEADIVLHPSNFIDSTGHRVGRWSCPLPKTTGMLSAEIVWERLLVQNFIASCAPVFRTDAAKRIGSVDEKLWYTADWDYWLRLTAAGRTLFHSEPLLSVRIHAESQTMRRAVGSDILREQYETILERHLAPWVLIHKSRRGVGARARLSAEINLALADWSRGRHSEWLALVLRMITLGPANGWLYLSHSRIIDRVFSRLRARQKHFPIRRQR